MTAKQLCLIIWCYTMACSCVISTLLKIIHRKLCCNSYAHVNFPDEARMGKIAALTQRREPNALDAIGFMDGVALCSECSSKTVEQNSMYSIYYSNTMINNVVGYGAERKVFLCGLNIPGSWQDASICANLWPLIASKIGGWKSCQGFPWSGAAHQNLVGIWSTNSTHC